MSKRIEPATDGNRRWLRSLEPIGKMNSRRVGKYITPPINNQSGMSLKCQGYVPPTGLAFMPLAGPPDSEYFGGKDHCALLDCDVISDEIGAKFDALTNAFGASQSGEAVGVGTSCVGSWVDAPISMQSSIEFAKNLGRTTIRSELSRIRTGDRQAIKNVRSALAGELTSGGDAASAKKAANAVKKSQCGYVMFSGLFNIRKNDGLDTHSGIVMFDLDDLDDVDGTKRRLSACKNVGAVFLSVSATGLRVLVPVLPIPKDASEHKAAYYAALSIIESAARLKVADHAGQDLARASFVTSDPDAHINMDAVPVPWVMRSKMRKGETRNTDTSDEGELGRRRDYVNGTFKVLDWKSDTQANIECPGMDLHTGIDNWTDCSVWIDRVPSIKCFHNSCCGKVEIAEREMRTALRGAGQSGGGSDHPKEKLIEQIDGKPALRLPGDGRLISEFCVELAGMLRGENLFARNGCAFAMDFSEQRLEPVTPDWLRTWIEEKVVCYKQSRDRNGASITIKRTLAKEDAAAVAVAPQFLAGLPRVEFFQPCRMPIMRSSGCIELLPAGHDPESSTFTNPGGVNFQENMTANDARTVIEEVLSEFPFPEDQGRSRAVAVAAMLTVFGAGLLPRGATRPVTTYRGNAEGTGKTTLAQLAGIPYGIVATDNTPTTEEEWQKQLLAGVIGGRRLMLFDNLKGHLDSPALERYTTATTYSGRILGISKEFCGEAGAVILITGNRLTISPDLRRRSLSVELFMNELRAEDRRFRRTLDATALLELQPLLLAAMWAMVRSWDAAGRPPASRNNASFPRWCETIGGIVEHAGFGCPTAPAEFGGLGDTDTDDIQRLGAATQDGFYYPFATIVHLCQENGLFERFTTDTEGDGLSKRARTGFSRILKNYDRRMVTANRMLQIEGSGHGKRYVFRGVAA
jgi:hypothetical protein